MLDGDLRFLLRAAEFAARKHRDQRRKDPDASPYINHPVTVARLLADIGGVSDVEVLAAALLHDTIEDTNTTGDELEAEFGRRVRELVEAVTDDRSLSKSERKRLQVEHAAHLDPDAAVIKVADKIANIRDVAQHPPAGWDQSRRTEYLDWAESVVNACPACNPSLLATFRESLESGRAALI